MNAAWKSLGVECTRWQDAGRTIEFWWRDDDATRPVPALRRLLALAEEAQVPIALAVVPEAAEPALFEALGRTVCVMQHGCDHRNRAASGEKKTEFPAGERLQSALDRLVAARARLSMLAGERSLNVLVPPWNRLRADLLPRLPEAGFRGLSCFGARTGARATPGLRQMNAHVDLVDWHGTRGFLGEEPALTQAVRALALARCGDSAACEPLGWLTHHAVHDEAVWGFLARLLEFSQRLPSMRWIAAGELFAGPGR